MKEPNKSNPKFINYKIVITRKDYSLKIVRSVGKKHDLRDANAQMRKDMKRIVFDLKNNLQDK